MARDAYPIGNEWAFAGLNLKDDYTTPGLSNEGGAQFGGVWYFDDYGFVLGGTGYADYAFPVGSRNVSANSFFLEIFVPVGWGSDGTNRVLLKEGANLIVEKTVGGLLQVTAGVGGLTQQDVSGWSSGRHTITIQVKQGDLKTYLDGGVPQTDPLFTYPSWGSSIRVGDGAQSGNVSVGSFLILSRELSQEEVSGLHEEGTLVPALDASTAVFALPSDQTFVDGLGRTVTPTIGQIESDNALLGTNGTDVVAFPTLATPRGFVYHTGDRLTILDRPELSFGNGVTDRPLTLSFLFRADQRIGQFILTKGDAVVAPINSEWDAWVTRFQNIGTARFHLYDASGSLAGGFLFVRSGSREPLVGAPIPIVYTYDGGGVATGELVFTDGEENTIEQVTDNYTATGPRGANVTFGEAVGMTDMVGLLASPRLLDRKLSELQVAILAERMHNELLMITGAGGSY